MKFLWEVKAAEDFSTLSLQENGTLNAVCFSIYTQNPVPFVQSLNTLYKHAFTSWRVGTLFEL